MKYVIEIITYGEDCKSIYPKVRRWFGWRYLNPFGKETKFKFCVYDIDRARDIIDKHRQKNKNDNPITFRHIYK